MLRTLTAKIYRKAYIVRGKEAVVCRQRVSIFLGTYGMIPELHKLWAPGVGRLRVVCLEGWSYGLHQEDRREGEE